MSVPSRSGIRQSFGRVFEFPPYIRQLPQSPNGPAGYGMPFAYQSASKVGIRLE
jgi:hypothetical protein